MKKVFFILISTIISLLLAEGIFRLVIFSDFSFSKELKDPGKYCIDFESDYWKLHHRFTNYKKLPYKTHPVLGWAGKFDAGNYMHYDFEKSKNKKQVLLFGDSFAECIDSVLCFEEILNSDSTFNSTNFLLNYGTAGYGVDQIFLTCSLSIKNYDNPFVVFSFMPEDMERSLVTVRTAPKPYFVLENNNLVLKGVPLDSNPQKFFDDNPVSIKSYMWSRYKHSDLSGFKIVPDDFEKTKRITEELNSKIILLADSLLKSNCTQYIFLIFDNIFSDTGPWRVNFLRKMMVEKNIPFICTSDLIAYDMRYNNLTNRDYFIPRNGHPGTRYNLLVSQAIKKCVENYTLYMDSVMVWNKKVNDTTSVEHFVLGITSYDRWLNEVKAKAAKKKLPVDSVIMQDAVYMRSLLNLPAELPDTTSIGYFIKRIKNSEEWLSQVKIKALQHKISLDSMIVLDAVYMHEQMKKK